jgi:hypothetical protein
MPTMQFNVSRQEKKGQYRILPKPLTFIKKIGEIKGNHIIYDLIKFLKKQPA